MSSSAGRMQSDFTAGELDPKLHDRTSLKYFATGLKRAENIVVAPQGGFRNRDGLRHRGAVSATAGRIFPFAASTGAVYDIVFDTAKGYAWGASAKEAEFDIAGLSGVLEEMTFAQRFDTMLLFHQNLQSKRIRLQSSGWSVDNLPYTNLPNYDYGGSYSNGVAAVWRLEFVGLTNGATIFTIKVNGQDTQSITFSTTSATMIASIAAAVSALPNLAPGILVENAGPDIYRIVFAGSGNAGDGWAVSGNIINKGDAAIVAAKQTTGVAAGETIISGTRGWPQCGAFWQQRLLIGGFKSLPNAWMASKAGDYFEFNDRFTEANGPFLVPMDIPGGENIEQIFPSLYLLIFTTQGEYWISERALSKTSAPTHVQASRNGIKRGFPVNENEGSALWAHKNAATIGELRYTDVEGNFVATSISLLAPHLIKDVKDYATRRATSDLDGNLQAIILANGEGRLTTLLREQEVTAYSRMTTDGTFKAVSGNARNEFSFLIDRPTGRMLERMEAALLLDEAQDFVFASPTRTISGLARFEGRTVWVIGDGNVHGPLTVQAGAVTLAATISTATVGTWQPPLVETLPPSREVNSGVVLLRRGRIHTAHITVSDTTSLAIATNGKALADVDLAKWGHIADVSELSSGFTGTIKITGLRGYADRPFLTISQLRPGRLNVNSITVEAAL